MSADNTSSTSKTSGATLAIAAAVQVAVVLAVSFLLMFSLRGEAAPEEEQALWKVSLGAPKEGEPPPVLDTWDSLEAMLADAPGVELVEHEVEADNEVFLLLAPADAKIETPGNNSRIRVTLNPNAAINFHIGRFDKQRRMDTVMLVHGSVHSFPFADEKALIYEHSSTEEDRYEGSISATCELFEFTAHTDNPEGSYKHDNTLKDVQLLLKVGHSLKLKESLPTETIPLMKRLGYRFSPDTDDPAEIVSVSPRSSCTPAQLALLEKLPNVERISIHGIGHGPEYFVHIAKCKNLKQLDSDNLWIDDECLQHLANCTQLERLEVNLTDKLTTKGFEAFKKLPNLSTVHLGDVKDQALAGMASLAELENLESLEFDIDGESSRPLRLGTHLSWLGEASQLRRLDLTSITPYLKDADLEFCGKLSQVEQLDLGYYAGGDTGMQHLAGMTALTELKMDFSERSTVTAKAMEALAGLPNLESLEVDGLQLTDEMLAPLAKSKVKTLNLDDCKQLTLEGVLQLKSMPNLGFLRLTNDLLTDEEVTQLKEALPDVRIPNY